MTGFSLPAPFFARLGSVLRSQALHQRLRLAQELLEDRTGGLRARLPLLDEHRDSEIALVSARNAGGPAGLLAQEVLRALERGPGAA
mgnify:CR=1 FL=1